MLTQIIWSAIQCTTLLIELHTRELVPVSSFQHAKYNSGKLKHYSFCSIHFAHWNYKFLNMKLLNYLLVMYMRSVITYEASNVSEVTTNCMTFLAMNIPISTIMIIYILCVRYHNLKGIRKPQCYIGSN